MKTILVFLCAIVLILSSPEIARFDAMRYTSYFYFFRLYLQPILIFIIGVCCGKMFQVKAQKSILTVGVFLIPILYYLYVIWAYFNKNLYFLNHYDTAGLNFIFIVSGISIYSICKKY